MHGDDTLNMSIRLRVVWSGLESVLASGSWLYQVPEAYGRRVPVVAGSLFRAARDISAHWFCASLAGRWKYSFRTETVKRHANDALGTTAVALAHHWQAFALDRKNRRRPANDAQVAAAVGFAHHWQACAPYRVISTRMLLRILLRMLRMRMLMLLNAANAYALRTCRWYC